jgi:hypothetical protein
VIRREVPDREFDNWRAAYASLALRSDRLERDARVLYGIALLCGELGQTTASRQKIAAFVGLTADDVERAVDALWQAGVVSIDGKPYLRKRGESAKRRRRPLSRPRSTRRKGHGRVFLAPPRILITDRKLWAKRLPRMRLEAWLRNPPKERTMSELLIPTARGARFADAYVANGGSLRKLAEEAGVSVRTLQRMPEVQTMIGLRQAVIDLLVIALRSIGLSPPVIAEELMSRGVKVSTGAVRRILDQRTRHAPAWAWEALLENQEIATLTIAALERHDQAAADELVRLLFNEVCQGPPSGQETTRSAGRETLDSANSVGRVTIVDTSAALCGVAGEEQNQDRLDPARDGAVSGCDRFGRSPPFDPSSTP